MTDVVFSTLVCTISVAVDAILIVFVLCKDQKSSIYCYSLRLSHNITTILCIHIAVTVCLHMGLLGPFVIEHQALYSHDIVNAYDSDNVFYIGTLTVCSGLQTMALYQLTVYFICENQQTYLHHASGLKAEFEITQGLVVSAVGIFLCVSVVTMGALLYITNFFVARACILCGQALLFCIGVCFGTRLTPHAY